MVHSLPYIWYLLRFGTSLPF